MTPLPNAECFATQHGDLPIPQQHGSAAEDLITTELGLHMEKTARWRQVSSAILALVSVISRPRRQSTQSESHFSREPRTPLELVDPIGYGMDGVFEEVAEAKGYTFRRAETCWSLSSERPTIADLDRLKRRDPEGYRAWRDHQREQRNHNT